MTLVEDNGDSHRIHADSVVFNRARSTLTARGSVRYERKSGSDDGDILGRGPERRSRTIGRASSSTARFADRARGRLGRPRPRHLGGHHNAPSADVMVLKDGVISSCDADDPHYAVRARRVWLLGDKEWAISDAVFSLGNVPMLWLPFFYYPGDELAFHPVIGYRSREGYFVQTTVYLIGAKPAQRIRPRS